MMRRLLAILSVLAVLPLSLHAQSLFGTQGLGVPLRGYDARTRALGVNGAGLLGLSTSMVNPAEPAGIFRRGITASLQPWSGSVNFGGEDDRISGTRFPLIEIFYPLHRFTLAVGYSGVLDQSWAIIAQGDEVVGGDVVATNDVVRSSGGIGKAQLSAAYVVSDRFSLGASVGLHTGSITRTVTREFPDSSFLPFETSTRWRYSGTTASVGFRWDPSNLVRVGASVGWNGQLDAKPDSGGAASYSYEMPLDISAGISAQIAPRLMFALSSTMASYGSGDYTAPATAANTVAERMTEIGAGLEWSEIRAGDRIFPLRVGARFTKLPFHDAAASAASETIFSGGMGFRLVQDEFGPLAVADLGVEKGSRSGWETSANPSGLEESFWRFTVSVSLFGR